MTSDLHRAFGAFCSVLVAATSAVVTSAPAVATTAPARGALIRAERSAHMSGEQVAKYLRNAGLPKVKGAKGVDIYSVTYRTIDLRGRPTVATGMVALPQTKARDLHVVSFGRGTSATKSDAPSMSASSDGRPTPVYFATHGFAAVAADYLGLGGGPGHHPYMHSATEASASLDMLKAARALAARRKITLDSRILVTGFSQGGHTAMALGAALQRDPEFDVAAIAPVGGPFDLEHAELPAALDGRLEERVATFYLAYWLTSMDRIYDLYDSPATAFRKPYAAKVTKLFDGRQSTETIFANLPETPAKLLTPGFLKQFKKPSGALLRAVRDNDGTCENVAPGVPVRLFAGSADRDVVIENSTSCLKDLRAAGVDARLINVGKVDHFVSDARSQPRILAWFRHRAKAMENQR